ncbi:MAG: hypothetical protein ABW047_11590 [Nitrospiraceae bacterium]|jgi:hypothetical protein
MRGSRWSFVILALLLTTSCSNTRQASVSDQDYTAPLSIYSVMDATALVYADPAAASPANDNPYRWAGFILHPVGQFLDYVINRPLYALAGSAPYVFGYTAEDAMLDSQRRSY